MLIIVPKFIKLFMYSFNGIYSILIQNVVILCIDKSKIIATSKIT